MNSQPTRRRLLPTLLGTLPLLGLLSLQTIAQTLPVTEGLSLWLKADAGITADTSGAVSRWTDQSGNDNHALQTDPTASPSLVTNALNLLPILRFDGTNDFLEVADSESLSNAGDLTTLYVVQFDDFAAFRAVWSKTALNLPGATDFYTLPNSGVPRLYRGNGSTSGLGFFDGTALRAGAYLVAGFGIEGDQASHFLSSQISATGTLTAEVADADGSLLIGTRGDQFTRLKGDLAEVLIYDRALSPTERAAVVEYLGQKYAILNLPPAVSLARTPATATVPAGTTLALTATATDPDGRIERVDFLANDAVIASASAPPFRARVTVKTSGDYRFSARAVDDRGGSTTSAELTATASGPTTAPTLGATTNLQLWLRADVGIIANVGDTVIAWFDQSGKSNDAFQPESGLAPIVVEDAIAGLPVIRFDGADDYLEVSDSPSLSIAGDITSLFVVRMENFDTFRAVWAKTQGNQPAPNDYYTLPGTGIPRVYRGDAQGSAGNVDGGAPFTAGAFHVAGFTADGGTIAHLLNGNVTATGTLTATPADLDTPLRIGTRDDFATLLHGDLAELLIYDTALSHDDLDNAQTYLGEKYKIGILAPTNTPPVATLRAPAPNTAFTAPAAVEVQAATSDSDGSIVRVEFLIDGNVAASTNTPPFAATLAFPTAGEPLLTVVAYDNLGGRSESAPVPIRITAGGTPPQLSIGRIEGESQLTLTWPADATGFVLQSTDALVGGIWETVPGVTGTSITVPIGTANTYFRLVKP